MDIKEKIEEIVGKLKADPKMLKSFKKDPMSIIKKFINIELPEDQLGAILEGVKAKINLDDVAGKVGVLAKLFGKKK